MPYFNWNILTNKIHLEDPWLGIKRVFKSKCPCKIGVALGSSWVNINDNHWSTHSATNHPTNSTFSGTSKRYFRLASTRFTSFQVKFVTYFKCPLTPLGRKIGPHGPHMAKGWALTPSPTILVPFSLGMWSYGCHESKGWANCPPSLSGPLIIHTWSYKGLKDLRLAPQISTHVLNSFPLCCWSYKIHGTQGWD